MNHRKRPTARPAPALLLAPLLALLGALAGGNAGAESLRQAWDSALAFDRGLAASRESTAAAASLVDAAKAARWPSVTLEAGYTAMQKTPAALVELGGASAQMPVAQRDSAAARAMVTVPLYTGGRIERGIAAAQAAHEAASLGERGDAQSLKLRVVDAYAGVLRAASLLTVADSHVASLEAHARDVAGLKRQGMVAKSELLFVRVALADAQQRQLQVANGLDLARAAYNRLLGRRLEQDVVLDPLLPDSRQHELAALNARALAGRSELAAVLRQIEATRHQAAVLRGEALPQVALSGGYAYQENRYQVHPGQWMVNLGARWTVFDGNLTRHRAEAAERQAAALAAQKDEAISLIALQVRQGWLDVQETGKRLLVTEAAITQAEENLRVTKDRYAHGLATQTTVLDAEALRVSSLSNHANAVVDAALASLRLKRAVGEL